MIYTVKRHVAAFPVALGNNPCRLSRGSVEKDSHVVRQAWAPGKHSVLCVVESVALGYTPATDELTQGFPKIGVPLVFIHLLMGFP